MEELITQEEVTYDDIRTFCESVVREHNVDSEISLLSLIKKGLLNSDILHYLKVVNCQVPCVDNMLTNIKDTYSKLSKEDCSEEVS